MLERVHRKKSGRSYRNADGKEYVSVTNYLSVIAKPALIGWAAKKEREMVIAAAEEAYRLALPTAPPFSKILADRLPKVKAHQKEMDAAADIGSQAHAYIEWVLRKELKYEVGPEPPLGPEAKTSFEAFVKWRHDFNMEPLEIEQTVYSEKYGYAGTLDLVCLVDLPPYGRVRAVEDHKTGSAIYAEAKLQNVAYSWAYYEMGRSEKPLPGIIARFPKRIEEAVPFETITIHPKDGEYLMTVFEAARTIWHWQRLEDMTRLEKKGLPDN